MNRRTLPLALLGIAIGIVIVFALLRFAPREKPLPQTKEPEKLAGAVLVEDVGTIDEVLFHHVQRLEPFIAKPYTDFLRTLDPSTKLVGVVATGGSEALHKLLKRIDPR